MENQQLKRSVHFSAFKGEFYKSINSFNADILLSEIKQVRNQLIQSKKISNYKVLDMDVENNLWDIPSNWVWTRAGNILDVRDGTHDTPKYVSDEGFPLITSKNLKNNTLDFSNVKLISNEDHFAIQKRSKVDKDDILFAMIGTIGNPVIVKEDREFSVKNVGLFKKIPETNINMEYIFFYLDFISDMLRKNSSGAVQSFVSLKVLRNLPVPLPPFEDQQIIVEYLNEINVHLSKIDQKIKKLNTLQLNFPFQLEKSILQYAIQGKLVKQDNKDVPASELLKRISEQKEQMVKEKIIKKEKALPPINEEEIPFDIPETWEWARLGNLVLKTIGGGTPSKSIPEYWNGSIPWASVKDLKSNIIDSTQDTITELGLEKSSSNLIEKGNLIVCTRMGLGKIAINQIPIAINQDLRALYFPKQLEKEYIIYYFKTLTLVGKGATVKGINLNELNSLLIPVPPLNEQRRIVSKIKKMFLQTEKILSLK